MVKFIPVSSRENRERLAFENLLSLIEEERLIKDSPRNASCSVLLIPHSYSPEREGIIEDICSKCPNSLNPSYCPRLY